MSFFYAKNASFDVEKYLMDLTVADYEIDDATNNISSGYDPASQTINDELLSDIEALGTVEQTGRLYSRQVNFTINEQTRNNLKTYYTEERLAEFASYDPTFPAWKEGFDLALAGESGNYTVYGADGIILEAATNDNYLLSGTYDADKFASGNYCLAIGRRLKPETIFQPILLGKKSKYQTGSLRLWLC